MLRPYEVGAREDVTYFLGTEVEKTPAYNRTTLFVVGLQMVRDVSQVVSAAQDEALRRGMPELSHIFFGANWSFDGDEVSKWSDLIRYFLREGFWCTLDFRPAAIPLIHKTGLCRHAKFIPLMGVRVPQVAHLGNNATLKIDDTRFAGSNKGVWCLSLPPVLHDTKVLTTWEEYGADIPLPNPTNVKEP